MTPEQQEIKEIREALAKSPRLNPSARFLLAIVDRCQADVATINKVLAGKLLDDEGMGNEYCFVVALKAEVRGLRATFDKIREALK